MKRKWMLCFTIFSIFIFSVPGEKLNEETKHVEVSRSEPTHPENDSAQENIAVDPGGNKKEDDSEKNTEAANVNKNVVNDSGNQQPDEAKKVDINLDSSNSEVVQNPVTDISESSSELKTNEPSAATADADNVLTSATEQSNADVTDQGTVVQDKVETTIKAESDINNIPASETTESLNTENKEKVDAPVSSDTQSSLTQPPQGQPALAQPPQAQPPKVQQLAQPQQPTGQSTASQASVIDEIKDEQKHTHLGQDEVSEKDKDFETFTEWKQKTLAEEQEKSKVSGAEESITGSKLSLKKQKKNNYASKDCGAKILASNPEAENANRILTSVKDDYMINPCKAKKWFTLELCEPVHVKSIEIASLELFSSQPKSLRVSFSDRYPVKEWQNSQVFEMTEERTLQGFDVSFSDDFFVKYVKVEMVEHFGEEHFCPLTLFKLYGIPVELDDYDTHHEEDSDGDMDTALLNNGEEGTEENAPTTLVNSVKESVLKLVKKVLNVEDKGEKSDTKNDTVGQNDTALNGTQLNLTGDDTMLPCVPDASIKLPEKSTTDKMTNTPIQPTPPGASSEQIISLPCVVPVINGEEMKPPVLDPDVSIVTKLEDHEQIPSEQLQTPLVTLISSGDPNPDIFLDCFSHTNKNNSLKWTSRKCLYYELMTKFSCHDCQSDAKEEITKIETLKENNFPSPKEDVDVKIVEPTPPVNNVVDGTTKTASMLDPVIETKIDTIKAETVKNGESSAKAPEVAKATKINSEMKQPVIALDDENHILRENNEAKDEIQPTQTKQEEMKITSSSSENNEASGSLKSNLKDDQGKIILQPSTSTEVINSHLEATPALKHPDSLTVSTQEENRMPETTDDYKSTNMKKDQTTIITESSKPNLPEVNIPSVVTAPVDPSVTQEGNSASNQPVVDASNLFMIKAEEEKKEEIPVTAFDKPSPQRDLGLVRVPVVPFQKRETAIMRLTNRIKILETNVSLSSRFLDQMTQKFKKQSNETYRLLNSRFENLTKEAEMRDQRQQEQINYLESRLQNLTDMVSSLQDSMINLNKQVTDRQMVWTTVEVIILVIIFLVCLRRGKSTDSVIPPEVQRLINAMPLSMELSSNSPRRNSFSGATTYVSEKAEVGVSLQKYSSDTALAHGSKNSSGICPETPFEDGIKSLKKDSNISRKRKKKKQKGLDLRFPSIPAETENVGPHSHDTNSAGLLFGSTNINTIPTNNSFDSLSRSKSHVGFWSLFGDKSDPKCTISSPIDGSSVKGNKSVKGSGCSVKPKTNSVQKDCDLLKAKRNGHCVQFSKPDSQNSVKLDHSSPTSPLPNGCDETWNTSGVGPPLKSHGIKKKISHQRASSVDFSPKKSKGQTWSKLFGWS